MKIRKVSFNIRKEPLTSFLLSLILLSSNVVSSAADIRGFGYSVYLDEDYQTALPIFAKLAEQADVRAQFRLGLMYENAQGVPAFKGKEAAKWYELAAEQGHASSQYLLAFMYWEGIKFKIMKRRSTSGC